MCNNKNKIILCVILFLVAVIGLNKMFEYEYLQDILKLDDNIINVNEIEITRTVTSDNVIYKKIDKSKYNEVVDVLSNLKIRRLFIQKEFSANGIGMTYAIKIKYRGVYHIIEFINNNFISLNGIIYKIKYDRGNVVNVLDLIYTSS